MRIVSILIAILLIQELWAKDYNLNELGAIPDGKTLCTDLVQKAIDDCSASGGGKVTVPSGHFLIGTIFLKDNVNLYLENGAVLLGSTKTEDYKPRYLVVATDAHNISISGGGSIDGQGSLLWIPTGRKTFSPGSATFAHRRPSTGNLVQLENCKNVVVQNVTLTGSESWTLHLLACDEVLISGVKIRNPLHGPNTDGIDIQASKNIRISDCDIYTSDDAIVIKNRHPKYYGNVCENITITNCILTTVCNAFKIGTESLSDFRNIVFSNSVIKAGKTGDELAKVVASFIDPENYRYELAPISGIAIETVDGANLQGVTVNNIVMDGVRTPIFIRLANRGAGEQKVAVPVPGTLRDVIISNVVAYGASTASSITSIPGSNVENVLLKNILIKTKGGGDQQLAQKELDEKIQAYPEAKMWGPMPVSAFFVRHVKGLQMIDIKISVEDNDMRPLMKFEDVSDLHMNNLQTNEVHNGDCVLNFTNVKDADILNIGFPGSLKIPWFSFNGSSTEHISIRTIDKIQDKNFIRIDQTVRGNEVKIY